MAEMTPKEIELLHEDLANETYYGLNMKLVFQDNPEIAEAAAHLVAVCQAARGVK